MKCLSNAEWDSGVPSSRLHPRHEQEQHATGLLTFLKLSRCLAKVFLRMKTKVDCNYLIWEQSTGHFSRSFACLLATPQGELPSHGSMQQCPSLTGCRDANHGAVPSHSVGWPCSFQMQNPKVNYYSSKFSSSLPGICLWDLWPGSLSQRTRAPLRLAVTSPFCPPLPRSQNFQWCHLWPPDWVSWVLWKIMANNKPHCKMLCMMKQVLRRRCD